MAVHAVHAVHRNAGTAGTARGVQTARSNELLGHNAKNLLFRDFLVWAAAGSMDTILS